MVSDICLKSSTKGQEQKKTYILLKSIYEEHRKEFQNIFYSNQSWKKCKISFIKYNHKRDGKEETKEIFH